MGARTQELLLCFQELSGAHIDLQQPPAKYKIKPVVCHEILNLKSSIITGDVSSFFFQIPHLVQQNLTVGFTSTNATTAAVLAGRLSFASRHRPQHGPRAVPRAPPGGALRPRTACRARGKMAAWGRAGRWRQAGRGLGAAGCSGLPGNRRSRPDVLFTRAALFSSGKLQLSGCPACSCPPSSPPLALLSACPNSCWGLSPTYHVGQRSADCLSL